VAAKPAREKHDQYIAAGNSSARIDETDLDRVPAEAGRNISLPSERLYAFDDTALLYPSVTIFAAASRSARTSPGDAITASKSGWR
jgi:hypothetical protein